MSISNFLLHFEKKNTDLSHSVNADVVSINALGKCIKLKLNFYVRLFFIKYTKIIIVSLGNSFFRHIINNNNMCMYF